MTNRDWLSLTEIARLWSDETGESADALERDLDAWFSEFVTREPSQQFGSSGHNGDTTNLLMGMLGGRLLQRETFAVYCEERGHDRPRFWIAGGAENGESHSPLPLGSPNDAASQALSQLAPATEQETPWPAAHRPVPKGPPATPEPAGITEVRRGPDSVWPVRGETRPGETAGRLPGASAQRRAHDGSAVRKTTRLTVRFACGLAVGLALVATGFALGKGGLGHPGAGPVAAAWEEFPTGLMDSLKSELAEAWDYIANLGTAAEASEQPAERRTTDLNTLQPVPKMAQHTAVFDAKAAELDPSRPAEPAAAGIGPSWEKLVRAAEITNLQATISRQDLKAALERLARFKSEAQTAKAVAANLARELVDIRRRHSAALNDIVSEIETTHQQVVLDARSASDRNASLEQDLDAARQRIAELEAALQALEVKADKPANELKQTGQAQEAEDGNTIAPTKASPEQAASTAGEASLQTVRATDVGIGSMARPLPPAPKPERPTNPVEVLVGQQAAVQETPAQSSTNDATAASTRSRADEEFVAAVWPEQVAAAEFIELDSLIANPSRYDTRQVVVTGALQRLPRNYRLQSKLTQKTLLVDVAGIHRAQHDMLEDDIAGAGLIGSVRAQISGKVVRGSAKAFHLVASDLVLVE